MVCSLGARQKARACRRRPYSPKSAPLRAKRLIRQEDAQLFAAPRLTAESAVTTQHILCQSADRPIATLPRLLHHFANQSRPCLHPPGTPQAEGKAICLNPTPPMERPLYSPGTLMSARKLPPRREPSMPNIRGATLAPRPLAAARAPGRPKRAQTRHRSGQSPRTVFTPFRRKGDGGKVPPSAPGCPKRAQARHRSGQSPRTVFTPFPGKGDGGKVPPSAPGRPKRTQARHRSGQSPRTVFTPFLRKGAGGKVPPSAPGRPKRAQATHRSGQSPRTVFTPFPRKGDGGKVLQ